MAAIMLFDLDGTLYQNDDIYRFFAGKIAEGLGQDKGLAYLEQIESFLTGSPDSRFESDWAAIVELAFPFLPEDSERSAAVFRPVFGNLREYLLSEDCRLTFSPRVREFIRDASLSAKLGVVTNGPTVSARPLLQKLGIEEYFHYIKAEAQKPLGLVEAARELAGGENQLQQCRVISIGDNYQNDIAPARAQGWQTAWVTLRQHPPGPATWMGRSLEDLLVPLRSWLWGREQPH